LKRDRSGRKKGRKNAERGKKKSALSVSRLREGKGNAGRKKTGVRSEKKNNNKTEGGGKISYSLKRKKKIAGRRLKEQEEQARKRRSLGLLEDVPRERKGHKKKNRPIQNQSKNNRDSEGEHSKKTGRLKKPVGDRKKSRPKKPTTFFKEGPSRSKRHKRNSSKKRKYFSAKAKSCKKKRASGGGNEPKKTLFGKKSVARRKGKRHCPGAGRALADAWERKGFCGAGNQKKKGPEKKCEPKGTKKEKGKEPSRGNNSGRPREKSEVCPPYKGGVMRTMSKEGAVKEGRSLARSRDGECGRKNAASSQNVLTGRRRRAAHGERPAVPKVSTEWY